MWPIICMPPAARTRGARLEGPGPSSSRLGTTRGFSRASGGATSSWCEAMVRTQPVARGPRAALAEVSTRSIYQLAPRWTLDAGWWSEVSPGGRAPAPWCLPLLPDPC